MQKESNHLKPYKYYGSQTFYRPVAQRNFTARLRKELQMFRERLWWRSVAETTTDDGSLWRLSRALKRGVKTKLEEAFCSGVEMAQFARPRALLSPITLDLGASPETQVVFQ
ncbi:hypothetical protein QE152_g38251 [Popillia japonica]|uniref:Uncharacterized protein n=1 Tax=Popillia japonica TaxID=7064 RepID=A0AAW1I7H8_POPJA